MPRFGLTSFVVSWGLVLGCAGSKRGNDELGDDGITAGSSASEDSSSEDTSTTGTWTGEDTSSTDDTSSEDTSSEDTTTTGEPGESLGVFDLTYYWVSYEGDFEPSPTVDIGTCQAQTLATVRADFAAALKLEGSGKLLDDRIVNVGGCGCGGGYDCFVELDPVQFPWGQGSQGNALVPFVSIATDTSVLPFGSSVYAPELDGVALPGGGTHDGCLLAADVGGGINGAHIDWFVGLKGNYQALDPDVPEAIELFEGGTICP